MIYTVICFFYCWWVCGVGRINFLPGLCACGRFMLGVLHRYFYQINWSELCPHCILFGKIHFLDYFIYLCVFLILFFFFRGSYVLFNGMFVFWFYSALRIFFGCMSDFEAARGMGIDKEACCGAGVLNTPITGSRSTPRNSVVCVFRHTEIFEFACQGIAPPAQQIGCIPLAPRCML